MKKPCALLQPARITVFSYSAIILRAEAFAQFLGSPLHHHPRYGAYQNDDDNSEDNSS